MLRILGLQKKFTGINHRGLKRDVPGSFFIILKDHFRGSVGKVLKEEEEEMEFGSSSSGAMAQLPDLCRETADRWKVYFGGRADSIWRTVV